MYKQDLILNDEQWLIYHKTQTNQTKLNPTKNKYCKFIAAT